jgi:hypothetical protein
MVADIAAATTDALWKAQDEKTKAWRAKLAANHPEISAELEAAYAKSKSEIDAAAEIAPEPTGETASGIYYPMFNHFGEEDEGPFGAETDPVEFAKNLTQAWYNTPPESRVALIEANVESIEAARANNDAKIRLDMLVAPAGKVPDEDRFDITRTKTPKGGFDFVAWTKKAQELISTFTTTEELAKFSQVNAETIKTLGVTAKSILDNYIAQKREALDPIPVIDEMPNFDEVPLPSDELAADKSEWEVSYEGFMADFANAKSLSDLSMISANAAMKVKLRQIKESRPDLADKLTEAYRNREMELKG